MKTIERMAEVDVRLFEMRKKQRQYPRMLEEKRRQLDAEQLILNELTAPWEALENQIGQKEATIQVALETIEKFEEHMKLVTTQKEFLAAKKQVEEARKINTQLQNEILEARMKQDELLHRAMLRFDANRGLIAPLWGFRAFFLGICGLNYSFAVLGMKGAYSSDG